MTLSRHSQLSLFILPMLLVAVIFVALALPDFALAQNAQTAAQTQTWMEWILWSIVSGVFGGLTYLTGMLLDWTILNLVLNFGSLFQSSGLGLAVNSLWSVVRDIFNLTFIFGLIFIGFQLIMNSESNAARKGIIGLIIAALMVNFSLFITKTVIDFSNIAAVQIARVIYTNTNNSISLQFANQMGVSTIWNRQAPPSDNGAPTTGYLYIFGSMIVFCVAAFSFAAGAVLLFVRFIVLNFMMILSPIMFLGLVFTPLQSYSSNYWKKFLNQCFFAPAFLLMVYFSLYILGTFTRMITRNAPIAQALTGIENGAVGGLAGLFIGAGFLVASVLIAQKMSATGVGVIDKFSSGAVNKIRGTITAGPRWAGSLAGRSTIGTAGRLWDKNLEARGVRSDSVRRGMAKYAAEAKFGGTKSAKSTNAAAAEANRFYARKQEVDGISTAIAGYTTAENRAPGSATDVQRIAMEKAITGASSEQLNKVLGKYKAGTERSAIVANMSASQYDSVMKAKDEDFDDKAKKDIAIERTKSITSSLVKKGTTAIMENHPAGTPPPVITEKEALIKGLSKASGEQLKVLGSKVLEDHAAGLNFSQIDDIKKSKDYTETEKERVLNAHKNALQNEFDTAKRSGDLKTFFTKLKDSDFAQLPPKILKDPDIIDHLTVGALDKIADKETLNIAERLVLKTDILARHQANNGTPNQDKFAKITGWFNGNRGLNF